MAGEMEPWHAPGDRSRWREDRVRWRRRTRILVLAGLTGVAAVLAAGPLRVSGVADRLAPSLEVAREKVAPSLDAARGRLAPSLGAAFERLETVVTQNADQGGHPDSAVVTETLEATQIPWPTPINLSNVQPMEEPGSYRALTRDGCCARPWWSHDGTRVYFLKKVEGTEAASVFEVPLWPPGVEARLADLNLASGAGQDRFTVRPVGGSSVVEDRDTGAIWTIATSGNPARVADDGQTIVWWESRGDVGHFDAAVRVFAAPVAGGESRELVTLWGASVVDFLPDGHRVLIAGRPVKDRSDYVLATLDVRTGELVQLAKGKWLSDAALSPSGEWVAYMVSLDTDNPDNNGLWLVSTNEGVPRRLPFVGSYRWRDDHRLAYIPQELGAPSDELWELDARTMATRGILEPVERPFVVANADWSISPGGRHFLYRSADDLNLWLMRLP